jgi:alpha-L-fucosidase
LQPHVVINDRAGLPADYQTPEQYAGSFQTDPPFESWITISEQWAYKANDPLKTLKQCIQPLVKVIGSDGNFNLSIGPMPTGEIEPGQVERLKEIGNWLNKYGQSIYATRGGPFKPGSWGVSTYKDNIIYLHVFSWQDFPTLLPPIGKKIILSEVLTGGTVTTKQDKNGIAVSVPQQYQNDIDTIIKLTLDGPANQIMPLVVPSGSLAANKPVRTSDKKENSGGNIVDDDFSTYWTADAGAKKAWLEVDLGKNAAFDRVLIHEANSPWFQYIEKFELQYKKGGDWKNILQGEKIGPDYCKQFDPVTARFVRLNISQAKNSPSIWEFQLFVPKK